MLAAVQATDEQLISISYVMQISANPAFFIGPKRW